jgi:osmotically-inducible protein OsmY
MRLLLKPVAQHLLAMLLVVFLVTPMLVAQSNSDGRIHDEVLAKLANDTDVRGGGFDVSVKNGTVTLKGQVRTQKAKEKAEKLTKKVKGVVAVDNQLTLFGSD